MRIVAPLPKKNPANKAKFAPPLPPKQKKICAAILGVVDQIQRFLALFLVKYDTKNGQKVPKKNQPTQKCHNSCKSMGGGGQTFLDQAPLGLST